MLAIKPPMEMTHYRDYRSYLRNELECRVNANAQYSLRAFARDLDMPPQMLSFVLSGSSFSKKTPGVVSGRRK